MKKEMLAKYKKNLKHWVDDEFNNEIDNDYFNLIMLGYAALEIHLPRDLDVTPEDSKGKDYLALSLCSVIQILGLQSKYKNLFNSTWKKIEKFSSIESRDDLLTEARKIFLSYISEIKAKKDLVAEYLSLRKMYQKNPLFDEMELDEQTVQQTNLIAYQSLISIFSNREFLPFFSEASKLSWLLAGAILCVELLHYKQEEVGFETVEKYLNTFGGHADENAKEIYSTLLDETLNQIKMASSKTSNQSPMTRLPDGIYLNILRFLLPNREEMYAAKSYRDLSSFSKVNRKINEISKNNAVWNPVLNDMIANLQIHSDQPINRLEDYLNTKEMVKDFILYGENSRAVDNSIFSGTFRVIPNKMIQFQYLISLVNNWKSIKSSHSGIIEPCISYIAEQLIRAYDSKIFPSSLFLLLRFIGFVLNNSERNHTKVYNLVRVKLKGKLSNVKSNDNLVEMYQAHLISQFINDIFGPEESNVEKEKLLLPWLVVFEQNMEKAKKTFLLLYRDLSLFPFLLSNNFSLQTCESFTYCEDLTEFVEFLKLNKKFAEMILNPADMHNATLNVLSKLNEEKRSLFLTLYSNLDSLKLDFLTEIFSYPNIVKNLAFLCRDDRLEQISNVKLHCGLGFVSSIAAFLEEDYVKIDRLFDDFNKVYPEKFSYANVLFIYKHQLFTPKDTYLQEILQKINMKDLMKKQFLNVKNLKVLFSQDAINLREYVMSNGMGIINKQYETDPLRWLCDHPKSNEIFAFLKEEPDWIDDLEHFVSNANFFMKGMMTYKIFKNLSKAKKGFLLRCKGGLDSWGKKDINDFFNGSKYNKILENLAYFFNNYDGILSYNEVKNIVEFGILNEAEWKLKAFIGLYKYFGLENLKNSIVIDGKKSSALDILYFFRQSLIDLLVSIIQKGESSLKDFLESPLFKIYQIYAENNVFIQLHQKFGLEGVKILHSVKLYGMDYLSRCISECVLGKQKEIIDLVTKNNDIKDFMEAFRTYFEKRNCGIELLFNEDSTLKKPKMDWDKNGNTFLSNKKRKFEYSDQSSFEDQLIRHLRDAKKQRNIKDDKTANQLLLQVSEMIRDYIGRDIENAKTTLG